MSIFYFSGSIELGGRCRAEGKSYKKISERLKKNKLGVQGGAKNYDSRSHINRTYAENTKFALVWPLAVVSPVQVRGTPYDNTSKL